MRVRGIAVFFALAASFAFAQDPNAVAGDPNHSKLCNAGSASVLEHDAGLTIQKVALSGKWGTGEATLYTPDKEIADGAIVFSHSSIQANGASTDLHPFALTLARAGAAVIMPERSLLWPPPDRFSNREGAVAICAERWLIDHTKVFNNGEPTVKDKDGRNIVVRWGYAFVGPRLCDPNNAADCDFMDPFNSEDCALKHYCRTPVFVGMGETSGDNTRDIVSDGGLRAARWIQRQLGLAPFDLLVNGKPERRQAVVQP